MRWRACAEGWGNWAWTAIWPRTERRWRDEDPERPRTRGSPAGLRLRRTPALRGPAGGAACPGLFALRGDPAGHSRRTRLYVSSAPGIGTGRGNGVLAGLCAAGRAPLLRRGRARASLVAPLVGSRVEHGGHGRRGSRGCPDEPGAAATALVEAGPAGGVVPPRQGRVRDGRRARGRARACARARGSSPPGPGFGPGRRATQAVRQPDSRGAACRARGQGVALEVGASLRSEPGGRRRGGGNGQRGRGSSQEALGGFWLGGAPGGVPGGAWWRCEPRRPL